MMIEFLKRSFNAARGNESEPRIRLSVRGSALRSCFTSDLAQSIVLGRHETLCFRLDELSPAILTDTMLVRPCDRVAHLDASVASWFRTATKIALWSIRVIFSSPDVGYRSKTMTS